MSEVDWRKQYQDTHREVGILNDEARELRATIGAQQSLLREIRCELERHGKLPIRAVLYRELCRATDDIASRICGWTRENGDFNTWATGCGHAFMLEDGDPADNSMKFCCYCGNPLSVEPDVPEPDEDDYCEEHGSSGGGEPGGVWLKSHCPECEAEERGYVEPLEGEQDDDYSDPQDFMYEESMVNGLESESEKHS